MVFLETVCLFSGRDYRLLYNAAYGCRGDGRAVLCDGVCADCRDYCENADFWGSDFGMAIHGMYYSACQRRAIVLSWYSGTIFIQDLYGSEEASDLSCERGLIN